MVRGALLQKLAVALAASASFAHAQPQPPATEAQARYWVYGAFLTHSVPEILGDRVRLGPELEQKLGVASGGDRQQIYRALMAFTDQRPLIVRKATAEEIRGYEAQAKRGDLRDPLFTVQAGDVRLLVQYDMQANTIPFVGQLGASYQPPAPAVVERSAPPAKPQPAPAPPAAAVAPKPAAAPPPPPVAPPPVASKPVAAPPVASVAPKPAAAPRTASATPKPAPARIAPPAETLLKPDGPCVVRPVMSEQDLANCRAAVPAAARAQPAPPPPPAVAKPQARVAPPPAQRPTGPCEIKPVMSEEDLVNCGARPR